MLVPDKKTNRNILLPLLCGLFVLPLFTACANLWYIPGETGDGPVVNNTSPAAVPVSLAIQEMVNVLVVTGLMNNWNSFAVDCGNDPLTLSVLNGVAPILQWQYRADSTRKLVSTKKDSVWHLQLSDQGNVLWEHRINLLEDTI